MQFAWWVGAETEDLILRIKDVAVRRADGVTTLPSSIGLERSTNPFIRAYESDVVAACSELAGRVVEPGAATFTVLRGLKDQKKYRDTPRPNYPGGD